jgi:hypothetical protein
VPKNLRLSPADGATVLPFDWETAGWGAPLADLSRIDLRAYSAQTAGFWGPYLPALERLTVIGRIYRLLVSITWELPSLGTDWVSRPIQRLARYDEGLGLAVSGLGLDVPVQRRRATRPHRMQLGDTTTDPAAAAWTAIWPARNTIQTIDELKGGRRKSRVVRLVGVGPGDSNVIAKHALLPNCETERLIHEEVLPQLGVPALRCYGSIEGELAQSMWLFLEDAGDCAYRSGSPSHRRAISIWLADTHARASTLAGLPTLPDRSTDYYLAVARKASRTIKEIRTNPALAGREVQHLLDNIVRQCDVIESRWSEIEEHCRVLPATLVHGGFGTKNVRIVSRGQSGAEARVFDWEYGGWGTPAADMATVDVDAYLERCHATWPHLDAQGLAKLSDVGVMLRAVSAIPGEARSFESAWPQRVLGKMAVYRSRVDGAMQRLGLS